MPMRNQDTMKALVDLERMAEGSLKGFADAAEAATEPELKAMFQRCSADCAAAAVELQALVDSLGGAPDDSLPAAATHQAWTRPDGTAGDGGIGLLEEAERVEDRAGATYAKALAINLPYQVRSVVQRQHDSVLHNHRLIGSLLGGLTRGLIRDLRKRSEAALPPASLPMCANAQ
jgi:uncharacterized protein (TIGR02284 family)